MSQACRLKESGDAERRADFSQQTPSQLENTHRLLLSADVANEHEVHKNIPNFGCSKSPCHLLFLFRDTHTHTPVARDSKVSTVFIS